MLIRVIPPSPHPPILYGLTFPKFLPDFGVGAAIPTAWSSQLQLLTSVLQLEAPSSVHVFDRAVGLVARVCQVSMDIPQREIEVEFVDGQEVIIPMNSDCVRILSGVVVDLKCCKELENQRNSIDDGGCLGSTASSAEDIPSETNPTKSPKRGKHKKQRSLLFSLISSLVPKSFALPSPPPPSSGPPPAPLPPLPVADRVTPVSSQQIGTSPAQPEPEILRRRIRATLIDVWRRYVVSALTPQHLPAAGYVEWTLIAMASRARAEIDSIEMARSHDFSVNSTRAGGCRHKRVQSEGRNAFDLGDRADDYDSEQHHCRTLSPFPGLSNMEDMDRVVYPRREQANEWGVRNVHHPGSSDEADIFVVGYNGHSNSLLAEFVDNDWDDNERVALDLGRLGRHGTSGMSRCLSSFGDEHLHAADFGLDCSVNDDDRLVDMVFDMSSCPLTPSDVSGDEESDDSQTSLPTPEDGKDLLVPPVQRVQGSTQHATCSAPQPPLVSRVSSSRPHSRNISAQYSSVPSTHFQVSHSPPSSTLPLSTVHLSDCKDTQVDELIASHFAHLEQVCNALDIVRSRAREEGWRSIRATLIGAKNGWSDAETERSLEVRAKRRAWSSGIKISAPYLSFCSASKVWNGSLPTYRPPTCPLGLAPCSTRIPQMRGPIVPTGLSLGIPTRGSPLATYVWGTGDEQRSTPREYGILQSAQGMETMGVKRSPRVTFADSATKLFPVREDDTEDLFEPVQVNAVGFPQTVPRAVSTEEPERDFIEGLTENEDDPFHFCPSRPRMRTTSMYATSPMPSVPPSPVLPMFRCSTPPPRYEVAVGKDDSTATNNEEGRLDASALLLQPLSSLSVSSRQSSPRPPPASYRSFVSRPRAVSLPTSMPHSGSNKTRNTYSDHEDEHCADLSQVYASPPPEGPLVVSATPAPHEQHPRYAHVRSPVSASKKSVNASVLRRTGKEVKFEQAGSEFTVGIEVALGRAEEGHVIW